MAGEACASCSFRKKVSRFRESLRGSCNADLPPLGATLKVIPRGQIVPDHAEIDQTSPTTARQTIQGRWDLLFTVFTRSKMVNCAPHCVNLAADHKSRKDREGVRSPFQQRSYS